MDAFEALIAMLLRHDGYWVTPSYKVQLSKEEKVSIGRASSPRWEIDLLAYKPTTNEILAVECKSFLDSTGVVFRNGEFAQPKRYKLFAEDRIWPVVRQRLRAQLLEKKACLLDTTFTLALAIGNLAKKSDEAGLVSHFEHRGWHLFRRNWIVGRLKDAANQGYENDIAFIVAKLLKREANSD
jgi:hypothetical protein